MLGLLSSRRNGADEPPRLRVAESTRSMLSGGADGVIAIYNLENVSQKPQYTCKAICTVGRSHAHVHQYSVETVQWYTHDTGMFLSSSFDKTLKAWDTNALEPAEIYTFSEKVYCHHMSPIATQHSLIAVGTSGSKVQLCDLRTGSSTHILNGHRNAVLAARWSTRHEFVLATGSRDNSAKLWDVRKATGCLLTLDQHKGEAWGGSKSSSSRDRSGTQTSHGGHVNGLCFTKDGLHLLTLGTDDRLKLWRTDTGTNLLVNYGRVSNGSRKGVKFAVSADCSPDLVFIPMGSHVTAFEIYSGRAHTQLSGHYNKVNCCEYYSDFQELYSGGNDSNILVWVPNMGRTQPEEEETDKKSGSKQRSGFQDSWSNSDED
ncbi:DNA excision repair protein ERCC-8 isoform X2 [Lethenteron reissneri]|uniref:DNA excision repair protein ERCC-8 isoform X2 n=1 Tax=Lethenteron reissneri TaxID=7753 RepID=UPI002AB73FA8|nr:DNA excision repair protein ERCC-8 isoform X2 [Lethenteron reissneri]